MILPGRGEEEEFVMEKVGKLFCSPPELFNCMNMKVEVVN